MKESNQIIGLQKKIFFVIVSLLVITSFKVCLAQDYYIYGYIVLNSNDTIYGDILDQGLKNNAKSVVFRQDRYTVPEYFSINDLVSFHFSTGKQYVKKTFSYYTKIPESELSKMIFSDNEPESNQAIKANTATAFVRQFVKGYINTYVTVSPEDKILYLIEKPGLGIKHIFNNITYSYNDNFKIKYKTHNTFNGTLDLIFNDCKNYPFEHTVKRIKPDNLNQNADNYNKFKGYDSEILQEKAILKPQISVFAGINSSNFLYSYNDENNYYLPDSFSPKTGFEAGAKIDFCSTLARGTIFYSTLSYIEKGAIPDDGFTKYSYRDSARFIKVNTQYIDFGIGIKSYLNRKNSTVRPYLAAEVLFGILTNRMSAFEYQHNSNINTKWGETNNFPYNEVGFSGEIGCNIKISNSRYIFANFKSSYSKCILTNIYGAFNNLVFSFSIGIYVN